MKKNKGTYSNKRKTIKKSKSLSIIFFLIPIILIIFLITKGGIKLPSFPDTGSSPFVSASGTNLYVNGGQYQFTGVNAFNLGSYAGNVGCGSQAGDLDAFFSKLRPNSTVRMWAFQGSMATNTSTRQTDWTGLDRVVTAAQKDGVKLILVLTDQAGTCDDGHWKDQAWYAGGYTQAFNNSGLTPIPYLDYVKLIVSHYKDSTAIAMWEPVNEPEASDCQGATGTACYAKETCDEVPAAKAMRSFFDTIGGVIKSIDNNHLVSSGVIGSGQCGAQFEDYQAVHASPGIDVASYHDYGHEDQPLPGDQWNGLQKRLDQMKALNKPLIIGEAGMVAMDNTTNCMSYASRRDKLKIKMDAQFKAGIAGFLAWDLTGGTSSTCNYDIVDNDPTLALLHDYPVAMGSYTDTLAPTAPANISASPSASNQVIISWTPSIDNVGVTRYDIFRNDAYLTSTTGTSITDTIRNPSMAYTYFVKAKDAAGNSSGSSNTVTTPAIPDTEAPTVPTNLTATQVTLSWTPSIDNVGVTRYDIFRNNAYLTSTTSTSDTITNLTPSTTYTFVVKAKDAAGNSSGSSNNVTITTLSPQN